MKAFLNSLKMCSLDFLVSSTMLFGIAQNLTSFGGAMTTHGSINHHNNTSSAHQHTVVQLV